MKSIRLSLIVYFLVLLTVAEAAAFWVVYRSAVATVDEKRAVNERLLHNQSRADEQQERQKFDHELLTLAQEVAQASYLHSRSAGGWERPQRYADLHLLSMLSTAVQVQGHLPTLAAIAEWTPSQFGQNPARDVAVGTISLHIAFDVSLPEDQLPKSATGEQDYFQINSSWNKHWSSATLRGEALAFTRNEFLPNELSSDRADDVVLKDGRRLHRVMFKLPTSPRFIFRPRPRGRPPADNPRQGGRERAQGLPVAPAPPPTRDRGIDSVPWIVIHAAREPIRLNEKLVHLRSKLDEDLSEETAEAQSQLAALRRRFLLIGCGTFLGTLVGGLVIGSIGLAPLNRLSQAVSRVSPKDFKLPLDENEPLPSELAPIRDCLQNTLIELRKAFEREKQASADISHELRTPVASLLTTVEVALKKPRSAEEYRKTLDDCRTIGRQMRQLVERIMALARLDAGADRLRPRPVDVSEVMAESAALVRPLAAERGLELRIHCPKPVTVTTDPDKLREVLVNLLHNAVQYNTPHGSVDVAAETHNGWLDLCVHDTGIGIEPGVSEQIFERFYRVDASRHADDLHAGLGLSIVKGYVGLLGGTISVESQPGQGSTFRVRLPAA